MKYLVGSGNRKAWRAAESLVSSCLEERQALVFSGPVGSGKSRLLGEIAQSARDRVLRVMRLTWDEFVYQWAASKRHRRLLDTIGRHHLLLLDDAAALFTASAWNNGWPQEVGIAFSRCSLICAIGVAAPDPLALAYLTGRVGPTQHVALKPPDRAQRRALLRQGALERDIVLTDRALRLLTAPRIRNIWELEGVINTLNFHKKDHAGSLDLKAIRAMSGRQLRDFYKPRDR